MGVEEERGQLMAVVYKTLHLSRYCEIPVWRRGEGRSCGGFAGLGAILVEREERRGAVVGCVCGPGCNIPMEQ